MNIVQRARAAAWCIAITLLASTVSHAECRWNTYCTTKSECESISDCSVICPGFLEHPNGWTNCSCSFTSGNGSTLQNWVDCTVYASDNNGNTMTYESHEPCGGCSFSIDDTPEQCSEGGDPCCGNICCDDPCCGDPSCSNPELFKQNLRPDFPENRCESFEADPVSLLTGAETFIRIDLTIGNLYPIVIQRRYHSHSTYDSPLGFGWAHSYDKRLYTYPGEPSSPYEKVRIRRECGWKKRFQLEDGLYVSPLYENYFVVCPGTCIYIPPMDETENLVGNADGTFTLTNKYGQKEKYDQYGRLVSQVAPDGNSLVFTYETADRSPLWGLLPANIDQIAPLIVSYDYRLSKIEEQNASGEYTDVWVEFHYDTMTGNLTEVQDSIGRIVTYTHDSFGNLTAVSGPHGAATYEYADTEHKHRMTSIDEGLGTYANTYDDKGRVIRQTHGTGIVEIEYTERRLQTQATTTVKDGAGAILNTKTRTVDFDLFGRPAKVIDAEGNRTEYTRERHGWATEEKRYDSNDTILYRAEYTYADDPVENGNLLTKTEAAGTAMERTTTYTYHPAFSKVLTETVKSVVESAQNKVITNIYDDTTGDLLSTIETGLLGTGAAYSYMTTYAYDGNGRLTSINGPRTDVQDVTDFTHDPLNGSLLSMTQPIIGTTTFSNHDPLGNPRTAIDPNGYTWNYTYDAIGRMTSVKAPGDANATQIAYLTASCPSCGGGEMNKIDHITLPEGNTIWYIYDTLGNLITIKDSQNNTINYTYDSEGNRLTEQIKDSSGTLQKTLGYSYDALDRLSKIINPDDSFTQYTYDVRGNRKTAKNPNGNITTYTYDALSRLFQAVQPGNVNTTFIHNSNDNPTSVTDANGNTTTYKYDDKGRVYQVISPDTGTTTYGYDPAGNMVSKTDAKGVTISYQYDAMNRLTLINFPSDTDTVYAYDNCPNGKGRLCSMTDASGTMTYEYTPKGQVKKETKDIDSIQYVTQYTYDQNGNIKTMTYPGGRVITYNYSNDRAVSVLNNAATIATNINYKPFGGVSSLTYGNGLAGTIGYDNQYRITSTVTGAVMNLSYPTYDNSGNIQAIQDLLDPTKNKSFTYDALDRLSTAIASGIWGSLTWTYDGVGNRLTENGSSYTYYQNTNRLNTGNGISFGYDNNGNTITESVRQYIYNQNQRLIQVNDGAMTANYTYNGNGQRVKKNVNGSITIFHYSLSGQIIAESNSAGTITEEYVYLNGQPLAKIEGANTYYYHNDHLGTPQKMTDSTGTVVWAADYKPFGEVNITTNTITNNLRFPGQYYDQEIGLHYNYFRNYNPAIGRYIESDLLNFGTARMLLPQTGDRLEAIYKNNPASQHLYVYAWNNSSSYIDPYGLVNWGLVGTGALQVITGVGDVGLVISATLLAGAVNPAAGVAVFLLISPPAITVASIEIPHGIHNIREGFQDPQPQEPIRPAVCHE